MELGLARGRRSRDLAAGPRNEEVVEVGGAESIVVGIVAGDEEGLAGTVLVQAEVAPTVRASGHWVLEALRRR